MKNNSKHWVEEWDDLYDEFCDVYDVVNAPDDYDKFKKFIQEKLDDRTREIVKAINQEINEKIEHAKHANCINIFANKDEKIDIQSINNGILYGLDIFLKVRQKILSKYGIDG